MVERDSKGKFKKGAPSPNKKGRPPGLGISAQIRRAISEKAPEIVDVLLISIQYFPVSASTLTVNKSIKQ